MAVNELVAAYRRKILAESDLLGSLEEGEIDRLLALARVQTAKRNELVLRKGQPSDRMYVLLSGRAAAVAVTPEGKQIAVRLLEPGDVFGEIGFLDGLPRTTDIVAQERCEYLGLHRDDFEKLVVERPGAALRMMSVLARRLRLTSEMLEDAAFAPLRVRMAKTLLKLADRYGRKVEGGVRIEFRLPQRLLAELVGSTRETVNMQVLDWEEQGLLDRVDRRVVVRRRDALEEIAGG